jgi:hypothetical protein
MVVGSSRGDGICKFREWPTSTESHLTIGTEVSLTIPLSIEVVGQIQVATITVALTTFSVHFKRLGFSSAYLRGFLPPLSVHGSRYSWQAAVFESFPSATLNASALPPAR